MKRAVPLVVFAAAVGLSFLLALKWPTQINRLLAWGVVAVGVVSAAIGLSATATKSLAGAIVDETNRYSQAALITLCWFVVIVSAYLACALWNVAFWTPESPSLPLAIDVPASIWVLAGIVGTDVAGTALTRLYKRQRGLIQEAPVPEPGDLTGYDEEPLRTDPAQLQKLLFQVAAVIAYAAAMGRLVLVTPVDTFVDRFPAIPEGFLALLGVSTGVALVNRSIPRQ